MRSNRTGAICGNSRRHEASLRPRAKQACRSFNSPPRHHSPQSKMRSVTPKSPPAQQPKQPGRIAGASDADRGTRAWPHSLAFLRPVGGNRCVHRFLALPKQQTRAQISFKRFRGLTFVNRISRFAKTSFRALPDAWDWREQAVALLAAPGPSAPTGAACQAPPASPVKTPWAAGRLWVQPDLGYGDRGPPGLVRNETERRPSGAIATANSPRAGSVATATAVRDPAALRHQARCVVPVAPDRDQHIAATRTTDRACAQSVCYRSPYSCPRMWGTQ